MDPRRSHHHDTHAKILTHANFMDPRHPRHFFDLRQTFMNQHNPRHARQSLNYATHELMHPRYPRHSRTHATHATHAI